MHKLWFALLLALATPWCAADAALERRVTALAEQLRCLVCQNQSIADSHAELAVDLRNQVREKLAQGMGDQQVVDFMVQRYGDFVLYRPPVKSSTWLLWFGPFLLLLASFAYLLRKLNSLPPAPDLAVADARRAAALLSGGEAT